ncbi:hypothetical protein NDU88_005428 [Pleurodeles waltl]|uniref:Uncharacterized protein n=1 Tax=Pleurodeles waltl TaxID=8319 RepID=A0AAV7UJK9_PLEWA|nr:hypothetical protein NDU88_005428 [Pleurodeles waltl]
MLRSLFGEHLNGHFSLERAHRSLGSQPPSGAPECSIIAYLLHYYDLDNILQLARKLFELHYQGSKLSIYPDFILAVQSARCDFLPAKKLLMKTGLPYALIYPAKLKAALHGKTHLFRNPKRAMKLICRQFKKVDCSDKSTVVDPGGWLGEND